MSKANEAGEGGGGGGGASVVGNDDSSMISASSSVETSQGLPEIFNRAPKNKPVQGLQYTKHWNVDDFVGKYHIANFATRTPIPGTAVLVEHRHNIDKAADVKRVEDGLASRAKKRGLRVKIKNDGAEMRAKIELGTMIGAPMETAEKILYEKEEIRVSLLSPNLPDSQKAIKRFFDNISRDQHNYISYALTTGFKSINAQDKETGDTPIQIAVRKGFETTVEELLKYCADPNLRNNLGNTCLHEVWYFWKTHFNRTREERLEQERKTCSMIQLILSYGGGPDAVNQLGESALHIACRMGPTKAVMLLLGFKASHNMRTHDRVMPNGDVIKGITPSELAEHVGKHDIVHLLKTWDHIRHTMIHVDFLVLWRKFLKDYEASITNNKDAPDIMFDLNMEQSVAMVERLARSKGLVYVDDPLLRQTYRLMRESKLPAPKPWEPGWEDFKDRCAEMGITAHPDAQVDHEGAAFQLRKKKTEQRAATANGGSRPKGTGGGGGEGGVVKHLDMMTPAERANARLPDRVQPEPRPRSMMDKRLDTAGSNRSRSRSRSKSPERDRSNKNTGKGLGIGSEDIIDGSSASAREKDGGSAGEGGGGDGQGGMFSPIKTSGGKSISSSIDGLATGSIEVLSMKVQSDDGDDDDDDAKEGALTASSSSSSSSAPPSPSKSQASRSFSPNSTALYGGGIADASTLSEGAAAAALASPSARPLSKVGERRMQTARLVGLDAKFFRFTRRPSTASALFLPLRTPTAPLDGTEEERSILRAIAMQGKEYELAEKGRGTNMRKKLGFKTPAPPMGAMGDYTDEVKISTLAERDLLYKRLNAKPMTEREAAEAAVLAAAEANKEKGAKEAKMQEKVEMINGRRSRFVEPISVPPTRKKGLVEILAEEQRATEKAEMMKKLGLTANNLEEVRQKLEESLLNPIEEKVEDVSFAGEDGGGLFAAKDAKKKRMDRIRIAKFLKESVVVVKYGQGRVTSTHRSTGDIESPWSTTTGRHTLRKGDRTF